MQNESGKKVSIIGCGWLGLPLARYLLAGGYTTVKGSTTSPDKLPVLRNSGIDAHLASLNPEPMGDRWGELLDTDILIVDIPPRSSKHGEEFHPQQIQNLLKLVRKSSVSEIIYVSSTSVYPELGREVREEDVVSADQAAAPHLVEAEQTLTELREDRRRVAVVRCGGLMGYDRIPGKYVQGKKGITTGNVPVNYIHRDDAVAMIGTLLHTEVPNETFNCVAPQHPPRRAVYEASCREFGWEVPTFDEPEQEESYKVVSPEKFTTYLNYTYIYKDPLAFYYRLP